MSNTHHGPTVESLFEELGELEEVKKLTEQKMHTWKEVKEKSLTEEQRKRVDTKVKAWWEKVIGELEDAEDIADAEEAREEAQRVGTISWEEFKKQRGL